MMRFLFVCLLLSFGARAEEDLGRKMALSISPIALPFGTADVAFQYNVARFLTLTLPAHFSYNWPLPLMLDFLSEKGAKVETSRAPISVGGGLGARFYPTGKGMSDGFYLEPRLAISYVQSGIQNKEFGKIEWDYTTLSPMLRFGWEWFYDSGFYSTFGAGIGYGYDMSKNVRAPSSDIRKYMKWLSYVSGLIPDPDSNSRLMWDLEFKIGFAW